MNKTAAPLVMSSGQREALTVLARSSTAAHREVKRAKVLLMAADGVANSKIAATVGVTRSLSAHGGTGSPTNGYPSSTRYVKGVAASRGSQRSRSRRSSA
jgi:hypothetical protein